MSTLWKKLKGNTGSIKAESSASKSPYQEDVSPLKETRNPALISSADEKPYLTIVDAKAEDPLLVKSQIVMNFEVLLKESTGLPHFLEFLQVYEVDHYAECWIECDKFRALALSLLKKFRDKEEPKTPQNTPCTSLNQCRNPNRKNVKNTSLSQAKISEEDKANLINILPDLVSNIPDNASVTPLSSPEETVANSFTNNENSNFDETNFENVFEESQTNIKDENTQVENNLNNKLDSLNTLAEPSKNFNSAYENLKQRLVGFATEIYDKFIDVNSTKSLDLPESIRGDAFDNLMSRNIDCSIFSAVQEFIYIFLEKEYFPKYLESEFLLKHTVEIFTSQRVTLQDILSCNSAIPYFMEYMEQEQAQPLLEFWISASNFKEHLLKQQEAKSFNPEEAQSDAMVLYDKYFSLQATQKLGFSDQVRFLVECNICQETGPSPNCFDVPLRIVLHVIQRDFMPGYVSSSLHIKFVSELVNTMRITVMGRKKRSGSGSTCISEESTSTNRSSGRPPSSISQSNTLLAMDSSANKFGQGATNKLFKSLEDPSIAMRIDSIQILDPDSLWRRKNFTKLSCGYVDELGRFESDLQPEPDRKMESKISKTLKKFVKIEEQKVKEDMAYKVAEMIIKDVTNVTLGECQRPKRGGRPVSCTEDQLATLSRTQTGRLQRSSSEYFSHNINSSTFKLQSSS